MPRRAAKTAVRAAPPPAPRRELDAALAAGDLARAADAALELGGGRDKLPENLRPGFDAVRTAFDHYQAGRDDDARAALDAIGLGSPFLEWKLLLRGLIAYQ